MVTDRFGQLPAAVRALLRPAPQPDWVAPMLATLTDRRFSHPDWVFERKLDGERCLAYRRGPGVRLLSRKRLRLEHTYPEVVDALGAQATEDFIVDGEVVAFEHGRTSFARLQQRLGITDPDRARRSTVAVFFYVFDLLHLDGHDTTALPLRARKALLREALVFRPPLRFTAHRNAEGEAYFDSACAHGWEGLIAKRADAAYVSGRSCDWLKLKCSAGQELVIGGFTDPAGSRVDAFETPDSPFRRDRIAERGVHWVRPELVAQVATEWTGDGKLRHPRFEGLRRDKSPREVVRERPGGTARA